MPKSKKKAPTRSSTANRGRTQRATRAQRNSGNKAPSSSAVEEGSESGRTAVRSFWSGTITFGLVSIPVDLVSAVQPRETALKLVDREGHALGRQYVCSADGKPLTHDDLVRGFETEDGEIVPVTDQEFESVAPEMSSDIELRNFVRAEQIPPVYFQKSYFLAPAGRSSKAYTLLAATMQQTGLVGIGSFVMRGHEYLVAIVPDNGVLRADTLRYADEIRTPDAIGLPKPSKVSTQWVKEFSDAISGMKSTKLNLPELEDREAELLRALVKEKEKNEANVIRQPELESEEEEGSEGGAKIYDLMAALRKSLSTRAVVTNAERTAPISLDARRRLKRQSDELRFNSSSRRRPGPRTKR